MQLEEKILTLEQLPAWRSEIRAQGKRLVVTNGCFDVLHVGHIHYLNSAREQGDLLLVGLNGDDSVRQLKGPERPINIEADRALLLAALRFVDAVCIFPEKRADRFLRLSSADVYVKGGDYSLETLDVGERTELEAVNAEFVFIPFVQLKSTSRMLEKIIRL